MQLAIDATLVSPLHCDGTARPGAAHIDGVALQVARRRKERTYPELVGPRTRSRLVVLAGEVGGRWSGETCTFVRLLAKAGAVLNPPSCARELNLLGGSGGQHSWHVLLDELLPALCWVFEDVAAWTVRPRSLMMLSASGATWAELVETTST